MAEYAETNRERSFIQTVDPISRDAIRRSMTRNSHYSHASVSASTRSWVYSTQQNPPPPPVEPIPVPSPARTPRPLPHPHLPQTQHIRYTATEPDPADEEEEYMNINPNVPELSTAYHTEGLGRGRTPDAFATSSGLGRAEGSGTGGRSFVGGFVSGLRRLPKVVFRYGGGNGEKRKFTRRGTFGTEGTVTSATGMTTGNTLPRYASNPPTPIAGPSNVQYVEATEMPAPMPMETIRSATTSIAPQGSQRRRHPSFRITPPSDATEPEQVQEYPFPETDPPPPQFTEVISDPPVGEPGDTTTVMLYHNSAQDMPPGEDGHALNPNRPSDIHDRPPSQDGNHGATPAQSPVLAHPPPAADYRKMVVSSTMTSRLTTTMTTMTSEPSFSSELNPVKRFFRTLHRMPWVAHDRVTIDYRPGGAAGGRRGMAKKPMASWYRGKPGLVTSAKNGTGSGDIDLLSGGSGSRRTSAGTGSTPISSPLLERVAHRSSGHRHRRREHHRRRRERDHDSNHSRGHRRRDTMSTITEVEMMHQRNASPILPAVYPYPYSYPYGYPTFPSPPPHGHQGRTNSQSTPRGPRSHRTPTYPHGYAPYQPPPPAPPVYVFQQSPTLTSGSVDPSQAHGQVIPPMYMQMQLVPGSFNAEGSGNLPPSPPSARPVAVQTT